MQHYNVPTQHDRSQSAHDAFVRLKAGRITPEQYRRVYVAAAESLPPMCKEHPRVVALIIDKGTPLCGECAMTRCITEVPL